MSNTPGAMFVSVFLQPRRSQEIKARKRTKTQHDSGPEGRERKSRKINNSSRNQREMGVGERRKTLGEGEKGGLAREVGAACLAEQGLEGWEGSWVGCKHIPRCTCGIWV